LTVVEVGLCTLDTPASRLIVWVALLVVVVEGAVQLGDPDCGAIVQYVGVNSDPASARVVFRLAMFATLFSANQAAFLGESYVIPIGPEASDGRTDCWYKEPPPVSFPRTEIMLFVFVNIATGRV